MTLIRTLITGGATPELEQILAEGVGMVAGTASSEAQTARHRCRLTQIALYEGPFVDFGVHHTRHSSFLSSAPPPTHPFSFSSRRATRHWDISYSNISHNSIRDLMLSDGDRSG